MSEDTRSRKLCPECGKEPIKSRMYGELVYWRTGLTHRPLFYEQGHCHVHDAIGEERAVYCPSGHRWIEKILRSCWCGWPNSGPYAREVVDVPEPPTFRKPPKRIGEKLPIVGSRKGTLPKVVLDEA